VGSPSWAGGSIGCATVCAAVVVRRLREPSCILLGPLSPGRCAPAVRLDRRSPFPLPEAVDAVDAAVSLSDSEENPCTTDLSDEEKPRTIEKSNSELAASGCSWAEPRPVDHGPMLASAAEETTGTTGTVNARAVGGLAGREGAAEVVLVAAGLGRAGPKTIAAVSTPTEAEGEASAGAEGETAAATGRAADADDRMGGAAASAVGATGPAAASRRAATLARAATATEVNEAAESAEATGNAAVDADVAEAVSAGKA
jgi:hypothetical protein